MVATPHARNDDRSLDSNGEQDCVAYVGLIDGPCVTALSLTSPNLHPRVYACFTETRVIVR